VLGCLGDHPYDDTIERDTRGSAWSAPTPWKLR
jgi:hypothetical protein